MDSKCIIFIESIPFLRILKIRGEVIGGATKENRNDDG